MEESSAVGGGRFGSGIARQQGGDGGAGGLAFEQHTAYGGGGGQFNGQALTQLQGGAGAAHAFGGHAARQDVVEAAALADGQPDLPVARERAGGGEHQVAQAGEPLDGFGAPAQCLGEALDLGQPAGDERGARIGAQTQAVGDAAGNGHDVLQGAAHFHPDHVVAGVDAAVLAMQGGEHGVAGGRIGRGDGEGNGQALGDFQREGRTGEHTQRNAGNVTQFGGGHFMRQLPGVGLHALAGPDDMQRRAAAAFKGAGQPVAGLGHARNGHAQNDEAWRGMRSVAAYMGHGSVEIAGGGKGGG